MGGFCRYGTVDIQTIGFVFLLILPRGRTLLSGSPALHHAGADRLQMVGAGSLHIDSPQTTVASSCRSCQQFYTVVTSCSSPSGLLKTAPIRGTEKEVAGRRKKNKDRPTSQKNREHNVDEVAAIAAMEEPDESNRRMMTENIDVICFSSSHSLIILLKLKREFPLST